LARVPILGGILSGIFAYIVGYNSETLGLVIFVAMNITFITLDMGELKKIQAGTTISYMI
jgi:uncharacterized membrane protein YgaE (UPF0421/DUF939 family)